MTLQDLEKLGYVCTIRHFRPVAEPKSRKDKPAYICTGIQRERDYFYPRGGRTEIAIRKDEKLIGVYHSRCSLDDNFCYKTGVKVALERAEKELSKALDAGETANIKSGDVFKFPNRILKIIVIQISYDKKHFVLFGNCGGGLTAFTDTKSSASGFYFTESELEDFLKRNRLIKLGNINEGVKGIVNSL